MKPIFDKSELVIRVNYGVHIPHLADTTNTVRGARVLVAAF